MRIELSIVAILLVVMLAGCDTSGPSRRTPMTSEVTDGAPPPPEPGSGESATNAPSAPQTAPRPPAAASQAASIPVQPAAAPPAAPVGTQTAAGASASEKAGVGVGAKGRDYGGPGFVTTPVETFFRAQERITFEAQIPNNMKIYKAQHDNKGPKTQEEFMRVIIQEGGVDLPELPAGDTYVYDPKTEQLLVRHPEGG
jgi:hypothetical protein